MISFDGREWIEEVRLHVIPDRGHANRNADCPVCLVCGLHPEAVIPG